MSWEQVLAVYAAAISSALAWLQIRKARRAVRLTAIPALNASPDMSGGWVRVSIQNHGYEPVHIVSANLGKKISRPDLGLLGWRGLLRYRQWHLSWWYEMTGLPSSVRFDRDMPVDVEPGRSVAIWIPAHVLTERRTDYRIRINDALDRSFYSPKLPKW